MKTTNKDSYLLLEDLIITSDGDIPPEEVPPVEDEFPPDKETTQSKFMARKRKHMLILLGDRKHNT